MASLLLRQSCSKPAVFRRLRFNRLRMAVSACSSNSQAYPEVAFYFPPKLQADFVESADGPIPVTSIITGELEHALTAQGPAAKAWATSSKFKAKSGDVCLLPSAEGAIGRVLVGLESSTDMFGYAALAVRLPPGVYQIEGLTSPEAANAAALGIMLASYTFDRYKTEKPDEPKPEKPTFVWPQGADRTSNSVLASAYTFARQLITTPAEDMGPGHIAAEAQALAAAHGASFRVVVGDDLLLENYPAIHTVGRASHRPPRLVDIRWAPPGVADVESLPRLSLVGKGVCFDTGGLNIKQAGGMLTMKTDMGGAALVLALAHVIMSQQLPVRLRVMVPTVENAVSGSSYRPLDVLRTRAGITVENMNTDAEGRLILSDAMYDAASEQPDLLIDVATLTGAARVALGYDIPAFYSTCDDVWKGLEAAAAAQRDPVWRMPLYAPYRKLLDSKVADIQSTGPPGSAFGGSITAALFLKEFVKDVPRWVHVDTFASNDAKFAGPAKPEGGEANGLRALWHYLQQRYAKKS